MIKQTQGFVKSFDHWDKVWKIQSKNLLSSETKGNFGTLEMLNFEWRDMVLVLASSKLYKKSVEWNWPKENRILDFCRQTSCERSR